MNGIDLVVFIFVGVIGVRGFRRGFAQEGIEAASALGGVLAGFAAQDAWGASLAIASFLPLGLSRPIVFVATAVLVTGAGFLIARAAARAVRDRGWLSIADNLGGLGFGIVKGVSYAALIVIALAQVPLGPVTDALDGSAFGRVIYAVAPDVLRRVDAMLPPGD